MSSHAGAYSPLDDESGRGKVAPEARDHPTVSFGIELEFALALLLDDVDDPHPTDTRAVHGIAGPKVKNPRSASTGRQTARRDDGTEVQASSNAHAQVQTAVRDAINNVFQVRRAASDKVDHDPDDPQALDLSLWTVSTDQSVHGPRDEAEAVDYYFYPVEIQSPAFVYGEDAMREVRAVSATLANTFRSYTKGGSVHVHVGFMRAGYTLRDLKHVAAIWWVFERYFYHLVPASRVHDSTRTAYTHFCPPLHERSVLAVQTMLANVGRPERMKRAGLDAIRKCSTTAEILDLCRSTSYEKLGFLVEHLWRGESLRGNSRGYKATIEIRIHQDCLDPVELTHWIKVCCGLMMFAVAIDSDSLIKWLRVHADNPNDKDDYSAIELLEAMKLPEQAIHYEGVIKRRQAGEDV